MSVTIASTVCVDPSTESVENEILGTSYYMASGSIQHDNISNTTIRTFTLGWRAIPEADMNNIETAYQALYTSASPTYTDIRSDVWNVTGLPNRPKVKIETVNANPLRYNVTISFIQRLT